MERKGGNIHDRQGLILIGYTPVSGRKKYRRGNAVGTNIGDGMYLQTSDLARSDLRRMENGTIRELKLEFKLPVDKEQVTTLSEISWLRPTKLGAVGMGVKFRNMSMRDKGKIARYAVSKFIEKGLIEDRQANGRFT